ncbi:MAG: Rpn family recombination-promoting nuclease/putative transposase [Lacrimispora saccharolytica]
MTKTNDWDSLGLSNDFLFGKVMSDPELCKELLGLILPELQIDRIEYPELQKPIRPDVDARSVRLDVYVKDNKNTVYDIEMQTVNTGELPKRSRYYQGMIDLQLIDTGQSYKKLNHSYVIFICLADIFGLGLHKYTFENICLENTSLKLKDGAVKIFLNTESSREDVSDGLRSFLDYVAGRKAENSYVQKLENAVREAKQNREWRHEYMTLLMRDLENLEKGREEGRKEGIKEGKIQQAKDTALTLKNMGLSIEQIATAVKNEY